MRKPMSSTVNISSARPLRSADRLDLFAPRVRTALAQCRAFTVTGPSSWNGLPHLLRSYVRYFRLYLVVLLTFRLPTHPLRFFDITLFESGITF